MGIPGAGKGTHFGFELTGLPDALALGIVVVAEQDARAHHIVHFLPFFGSE
jgi:hypothetical protein